MPEIKKPLPSDTLQWAWEKKRKAAALIRHTASVSSSLFSSNDITPFLKLTSRLHHFDARNLLLIYECCPDATCLAGYKFWEKMMQPKGAQVLKKEWVGKGIDLLAPFTDSLNGKHLLVWYCVTMYDVGQTHVSFTPPPSIYSNNSPNIHLLLKSIQKVLSAVFGQSVVYISPTKTMRAAGIPGLVVEGKASIIQLRSDISEQEQLRWLTEILIRLFLYKTETPPDHEFFLVQSASYCMFQIWCLPELLRGPIKPVSEASEEIQLLLLSHLQQTVRWLDDIISRVYRAYKDDEEGHTVDFDIDQEGE